jgi:hypothetical protein
MITIDWGTKVINVPQSFLTPISGVLYELDVNAFRLALKDLEDSAEGMPYPDTHRHNTELVLSGTTYARSVEIINGYTVAFEDVGSHYTVRCVGANHNIADVLLYNDVNLIIGNSAGLQIVTSGSGLSIEQDAILQALAKIHGLLSGTPLVVTPTSRTAGDVTQTIDTVGTTVTVTRT